MREILPEVQWHDFKPYQVRLELRFGEKCSKEIRDSHIKNELKLCRVAADDELSHPSIFGLVQCRQIWLSTSSTKSARLGDWNLPQSLLTYRSVIHETTGYHSSQMLFSLEIPYPCGLQFSLPPHTSSFTRGITEMFLAHFEDSALTRDRFNLATEENEAGKTQERRGHDFQEDEIKFFCCKTRFKTKDFLQKLQSQLEQSIHSLRRLNDVVWFV
ncbi:hypothetical protein NPIL_194431 [Nephila pilipes]|uniref:Uncharacterized protein n=1 Tax=Nephila pilipes TaxID=299642 RepID=A0A8X6MAA7_NEPPI|nr:hypothetical protein NPIL_194431 [Nephila pilipes]